MRRIHMTDIVEIFPINRTISLPLDKKNERTIKYFASPGAHP
jgi:hypothetical protein